MGKCTNVHVVSIFIHFFQSNPLIETWAHDNYMVNFPMFSKINVLDENVPEAWQYLIGMYTSGDIFILYAAESFNRTS